MFRAKTIEEYQRMISDFIQAKEALYRQINETIRLQRAVQSELYTIPPVASRLAAYEARLEIIEDELGDIRHDLNTLRDNRFRVVAIDAFIQKHGREGNEDLIDERGRRQATLTDIPDLEQEERTLILERQKILNDHLYRSARRQADEGGLDREPLDERIRMLKTRRVELENRRTEMDGLIKQAEVEVDAMLKQPTRKFPKVRDYSEAAVI